MANPYLTQHPAGIRLMTPCLMPALLPPTQRMGAFKAAAPQPEVLQRTAAIQLDQPCRVPAECLP